MLDLLQAYCCSHIIYTNKKTQKQQQQYMKYKLKMSWKAFCSQKSIQSPLLFSKRRKINKTIEILIWDTNLDRQTLLIKANYIFETC